MANHTINSPLVIALTGPVGSGVSTLSHCIKDKLDFHRLSMSRAIKQSYRQRERITDQLPFDQNRNPDWRKTLQDIGDEKRNNDPEYWIKIATKDAPSNKPLVIDGVRNLAEINWIRKTYPNSFVVSVVAPTDIRWTRLSSVYAKDLTAFERDDNRDSDEDLPHGQQVELCVQESDYVFLNETQFGSTAQREKSLFEKIQESVALMQNQPGARYPTQEEVHITSAYAAAYSSRCLKRFVGAVIVDSNGMPLSLGYNENPIGMEPCENAYNYCFKDANMEQKLEVMKDTHCPQCGEKIPRMSKPWKCEKCKTNLKLRLFPSRNMELCTAIHAEERAIRSLSGRPADNATIYVTTFPCFQCSRYIIDAGIKRVVYVEAYPVLESKEFLENNSVTIEPFEGFKARAFNRVFKQRD